MSRLINLLAVLFLIWLLNISFQERPEPIIPPTEILGTERTPDFYAENLMMRRYTGQGELQSLLKTKRLTHYPDQDYASLLSPELTLFSAKETIESISANAGSIQDTSRDLLLTEEVRLIIQDKGQQIFTLETSIMHYDVAGQLLWTQAPVVANSQQGHFSADGLQMQLQDNQLLLEDNVRLHYDLH